ncbi:phosphoribosylformylglycinamidine cyclo-ligase [Acidothermaceae bacterium B102]|nr:phosphoribosylformylglycinamidine cyclo-ligase [Acidothermaceae bacterium B102]
MTDHPDNPGATYAAAGVSIEAGDRAVELMKAKVARATRPEVVGDLGGFAGLFAVDFTKYKKPLLASSTDGVGTKLTIAQAMNKHDTIGQDLVGMVVDDLVVCGAEPLFMLDYIACGQVVPERMADIVGGIAEGCRIAGCALVGGETAEHPGVMGADEYDLAGAGVGIVDADAVLGSERVREGDVVIAMASSGLHSNGYSLARHVLLQSARLPLDAELDELDATLGEVLLTPTKIYAKDCLALMAEVDVHAYSHITGGGFASNLSRVLPEGLDAVVDRSTWALPAIVRVIADRGRVAQGEMERTFNMGVGMVAIVAAADADRALAVLMGRHVRSWIAGSIVASADTGGVARLVSAYTT